MFKAISNKFKQLMQPQDDEQDVMSFGDPLSSVDISHISDYMGVFQNHDGQYYVPPMSIKGLIQLRKAHPIHGSLPRLITNLTIKYMEPNKLINRLNIMRIKEDLATTGNGYFYLSYNKNMQIIKMEHLPAINMRKMVKSGYCWLNADGTVKEYKPHEIYHIMDYDPEQQIYGLPFWAGAIQAILLGEDVTLFPRRFFRNGAHAGNLIITSGFTKPQFKMVVEQIKGTKGVGNFRTNVINSPKGNKKAEEVIKVIPIGEIASKVEYDRLMSASKNSVLQAWRIHPELAGMQPEANVSTGDLEKILMMNYENEIIPYQQELQQINELLPTRYHIKFRQPDDKRF